MNDRSRTYDADAIKALEGVKTQRRDYTAPPGYIWVCRACGKTARNRRGDDNPLWDESCAVHAVLCREDDSAPSLLEPLVPNKKTIEAMKAAERGEVTKVGHPRNLIKSLNADR